VSLAQRTDRVRRCGAAPDATALPLPLRPPCGGAFAAARMRPFDVAAAAAPSDGARGGAGGEGGGEGGADASPWPLVVGVCALGIFIACAQRTPACTASHTPPRVRHAR
jgi:hypothetical protein